MNQLAARREIATRTAITLFILVLLVFLFMDYNNRAAQYNRLLIERDRVADQRSLRQATQIALQTQIEYANSPAGVREYSYTSRLYQAGDVPVVIMNPVVSSPAPQPTSIVEVVVTSNPQVWLALFLNPPEPPLP